VFASGGLGIDTVLDDNGNVPPGSSAGLPVAHPIAEVTRYVNLWDKLWSDEYVAALPGDDRLVPDHIPFPGAAAREDRGHAAAGQRDVTDPADGGRDPVHLADVRVPLLTVLASATTSCPSRPPPADRPGGLSGPHELRSTRATSAWWSAGRRRRPPSRRSSTSC